MFREKCANGVLHCGGEIERGALFQKGHYRANVVSHVGHDLAVVAETAKYAAKLFDVRRHWHACQSGNAIVIGANAIGRDDVTRKSTRAAPIRDLSGESFRLWRRKRAKKVANVAT